MSARNPDKISGAAWANLCREWGRICKVCGAVPELGKRFDADLCDDCRLQLKNLSYGALEHIRLGLKSKALRYAPMTENWRSFVCYVNDSLASIFLNLGLRNDAPILSKPWLLWIWVYFQSPRTDGLPHTKEAPEIFRIEDALTQQLSRNCGAIFAGRITTEGRREFYFYGETRIGFSETVAMALADFGGYRFDTGEEEDSLWGQYLNVLYPSLEDLERIRNQDLLDLLEEKGDVLTAARQVEHWMYFPTDASRASFRRAAVIAGFRIASDSKVDGELPFGISIVRTQSVEQITIDGIVIELLRLARKFQGEYDGWETPVITQ